MTRRNIFVLLLGAALASWVPSGAASAQEPENPGRMTATPLSGDPSNGFSFLVYGDIQENPQNDHGALVDRMAGEEADLVFNTGDISRDRGRGYAREFLPAVEPLTRRLPFFPVPGNHDVDWGSPSSRAGFQTFFAPVLKHAGRDHDNPQLLEPDSQKLWYRIRYGDVLFIVLDSNLFIDEGKYGSTHALPPYTGYREEQLRWLEEVLEASARDDRIRARFVFFHHSPIVSREAGRVPIIGWLFRIGGHPGHRRMMMAQRLPGSGGPADYLLDLFRYYDVTAVFSGHEHYYERWRERIEDGGRPVRDIHWMVTGLGGVKPRGRPEHRPGKIAELRDDTYAGYLERVQDLDPGWEARLEHQYPTGADQSADFAHYVRVRVTRDGIRFETIDTAGRVRDAGWFRR